MKKVLVTLMISMIAMSASAGQVLSLQPGETLPLSNGDVVACQPGAASVPKVIVCSMDVDGYPPFIGRGWTDQEAKADAIERCYSHVARVTGRGMTGYCSFGSKFNHGITCK